MMKELRWANLDRQRLPPIAEKFNGCQVLRPDWRALGLFRNLALHNTEMLGQNSTLDFLLSGHRSAIP